MKFVVLDHHSTPKHTSFVDWSTIKHLPKQVIEGLEYYWSQINSEYYIANEKLRSRIEFLDDYISYRKSTAKIYAVKLVDYNISTWIRGPEIHKAIRNFEIKNSSTVYAVNFKFVRTGGYTTIKFI